jgi:replicative DNA helicase
MVPLDDDEFEPCRGLPPESWETYCGRSTWPMPDRSRIPGPEAVLLGTALLAPKRATEILGDLAREDFAEPKHRAVLTAIRAVLAQGWIPEWALVLAAYARGDESGVPVATFGILLAECIGMAAAPALAPQYRRVLLEARWRRDAVRTAGRIAHAAEHRPAAELHDVLNESLADLAHTLARMAGPTGVDTHGTASVPCLSRKEAA